MSAPSVQPPCAVGRGLLEEGTRLGAGRGCGSFDAMCDPCGVAPMVVSFDVASLPVA